MPSLYLYALLTKIQSSDYTLYIASYSVLCYHLAYRYSRHTIVPGRKKMSFSHLCILVMPGTKIATELPASQGSPHSNFEGNSLSHFPDTSRHEAIMLQKLSIKITYYAFKNLPLFPELCHNNWLIMPVFFCCIRPFSLMFKVQ